MRSTIIACLVALLAGVGLGVAFLWVPAMGDLTYVDGSTEGLTRARREGRPVLFYFTASWCGACRQMSGSVFRDAETLETVSGFTPVLVDADEEPEFGARYGLRLLPSVVFTDAEGKALATVHGRRTVEEFRKLAREARAALAAQAE